jgi:hypothetical protein
MEISFLSQKTEIKSGTGDRNGFGRPAWEFDGQSKKGARYI